MQTGKKVVMKQGEMVLRSDEKVRKKDLESVSKELIQAERCIQILSSDLEVRYKARVRKYGADWTLKELEDKISEDRGTIRTKMQALNEKTESIRILNFGGGQKGPA